MRSDALLKSLLIKLTSEFSRSWEFKENAFSDSVTRGSPAYCSSGGRSGKEQLTDLSISSRKDQGESWVSFSSNKEPSLVFRFWMLLDTFSLAKGDGSLEKGDGSFFIWMLPDTFSLAKGDGSKVEEDGSFLI